jgi:UDP-N-acetylglucosamine transferase subunit ALG13
LNCAKVSSIIASGHALLAFESTVILTPSSTTLDDDEMTTPSNGGPKIFVTVGSTKFIHLVEVILSAPVLNAVSRAANEIGKGDASIVIQFGATPIQEVLFGKLQDGGADEGTLPIKLLGGKRNTFETDQSKIANSLSPDAIKKELRVADKYEDDQLGFKHFTTTKEASHSSVHIEFIDYVKMLSSVMRVQALSLRHFG